MPISNNALITVSIVTGKKPEHLVRCLNSLAKLGQQDRLLVYVINNQADFDVNEILKQNYPSAKVIYNTKRKGFGANHNQVLRNLQTPYALIINDDIELDKGCINRLYAFMESHSDTAIVGPMLYESSWQGRKQTAGGLSNSVVDAHWRTILWHLLKLVGLSKLANNLRGHKKLLENSQSNPVLLEYISGACCMIRKKALDKVGAFDEHFYMYLEDVDLGKRLAMKGWKCYQVPEARIVHYEASSFSSRTYNWVSQSAVYYAQKYHSLINQFITYWLAIGLRAFATLKSKQRVLTSDMSRQKFCPQRILVLKLGGVGDVLLITPALRSLRRKFPKATINLVTQRYSSEIIKKLPYTDNFIYFPPIYISLRMIREMVGLIKLLWHFIAHRYDIYIEFQNLYSKSGVIKPLLIGYLSGAKRRLGLDTYKRGWFLTDKIPDDRFQLKHNMQRYLEVVKLLGCDTSNQSTEIPLSSYDRNFANSFLIDNQIQSTDLLVGIHPGGNPAYPIRTTWAPERFIEVANNLIKRHNAKIILTAGPSGIELVNQIKKELINPPIILSGVRIKQLAAVIAKCQVFISNDTGPMHIAVAMKVPTIGIFGSTDWNTNGSYPPDTNFTTLRKPINCWPCQDLKCTTRACMNLVTVDDVLEAVERQIAKLK